MIAWLHAAIVIFLVVIFPPIDRRFARNATRLQMYAMAMIVSWTIAILLVATIPFRQLWDAPKVPMRAPLWLLIEVVVVMLLGMFVSARRGAPEIDFLLPRGRTERIVFALAAISAGITEEIIYRGFMIRYFEQWSGIVIAIFLAAIAFGLVHIYQGWRGALTTFFLALVFTFLFFVAGSLWLPMLVHAAADLRLLLAVK
jgi:membrane protease YdiL (CAAX protease family)